jgi:hypothetical protein
MGIALEEGGVDFMYTGSPEIASAPNSNLYAWAQYYVCRGFSVFPTHPILKKGLLSEKYSGRPWGATNDPAILPQIRLHFNDTKRISVVTGWASGVFVMDVDTLEGGHAANGFASLAELEAKHGKLPDTLTAESPSGSKHFYFRMPDFNVPTINAEIDKKTGKLKRGLAPGIDIKANNGTAMLPPSVNIDGRAYKWNDINQNIADAPLWLLDWLRQQIKPERKKSVAAVTIAAAPVGHRPQEGSRAAKVLASECAKLAETQEGDGRNAKLLLAAKAVGRYVAIGEIAQDVATHDLIQAAKKCGTWDDKGEDQCMATIRSGFGYGAQDPAKTAPELFGSVTATKVASPATAPSNDSPQSQLIFFGERPAHTRSRPLIKGFLSSGATSSLFGPPKTNKSTMVVDIMVHLGSRPTWRGLRIPEPKAGLYLAFERSGQVLDSLDGYWCKASGPLSNCRRFI